MQPLQLRLQAAEQGMDGEWMGEGYTQKKDNQHMS